MADVLMVSSSFLPGRGGIESYLDELCLELSASGTAIAVLAAARREGRPLPSDLGYPTTGFRGRMVVPGPRAARAISRAAQQHSTERILFGTPWPLVLLGPHLKRRGLRYAVIVHGAELLIPASVPLLRSRLAAALAEADLVLPVSDFTAGKIADIVDRAGRSLPATEVLRARVDTKRFHPERRCDDAVSEGLGLSESHKVVLSFGRLVRRKGAHRAIDAMADVVRSVPEAVLVIGGTGPEERALRRRARTRKLPVVFAGKVAKEHAPGLFARADVFVLPVVDRWFGLEVEGLGVVLLEASAAAVPCVTGRSGGTPEAVIEGETGYVIDARDRSQLAARVSELLTDRTLAARMGAAARAHVEERFGARKLPGALVSWLR